MLHKLNEENHHVSLTPDIPADKIAHQLSDIIVNSQSFFYGNINPQQRARMRRDFNQNLMPVLQNNLVQTPTPTKMTAQIDQIQTNLIKYYCVFPETRHLNDGVIH